MERSYAQPIKDYRMSDQPEKRPPTPNDKNPAGTVASPERQGLPSQKPGSDTGLSAAAQKPANQAPDSKSDSVDKPSVSADSNHNNAASGAPASSEPAASAVIVCSVCGFKNRPGVLFCEHCGSSLSTGENMVSTKKLDSNDPAKSSAIIEAALKDSAAKVAPEAKPAMPSETISPGTSSKPAPDAANLDLPNNAQKNLPGTADLSSPAQVQESAKPSIPSPIPSAPAAKPPLDIAAIMAGPAMGTEVFEKNMVLRLEVEGATTPILVYPRAETRIGRRDPATGTMPDVDLTAFAGYRMGVSRNHCLIKLRDQRLEVHDLGSSNGTTLNGTRLDSHKPANLRNGDELILGKMVIRVTFQRRS